jgi:soluble lytic murein transglycosylase-like protein
MILGAVKAAAVMTLLAAAIPARADVLEVDAGGEARWIAGPIADSVSEPPAEGRLEATYVGAAAIDPALAVPAAYAAKIAELAARFDLSPALLEAVVWQESRWRANALSPVGARGLAQLMPGTAREMGVDPDDPFANLEGGARYLRQQLDRFDGDVEKALAAYNAGPGRVAAANGIPRIRETQLYVASVMGRLSNHSRSSD